MYTFLPVMLCMNSQRSATSLLPYSAASVTLVGPCSSPYKSTVVSVVLSEGVTSVSVISAVVAEVSDPGSTAFVPSVVGLIIAGEVIKDLIKEV